MYSNSNTNFYTYDFIDTSFYLNELSLKDSSNNIINVNNIDYSNNFIIINDIYYPNFSYKIISFEDILELMKYFHYNFIYNDLFEIYLTSGKISSNVNYTRNINLCITYKDNNNKDYNIIYDCLNFLITNGAKYFNVLVDVYYYDNLENLNNYYEKYNITHDLCYNIFDYLEISNNNFYIDPSNLLLINEDISKCINNKLKNNDFRNSIINYNISCGEILNTINYYYLYNIDLSINYVKKNNLNYQNIITISNNNLYSFDINKITNYDGYFSNICMHAKFLWVYANNMNYDNPIKIYDCGIFNSKYVKLDNSNNYVINYISVKNTDISKSNLEKGLLYIV